MELQAAIEELQAALNSGDQSESVAARLPAARQVLLAKAVEALGQTDRGAASLHDLIAALAVAPASSSRRTFAILVIHALATPGLVPGSATVDLCRLVESALAGVLHRSNYPFGGSTYEKRRNLERLQPVIGDLLQPFEPTFPNWQGLYAG